MKSLALMLMVGSSVHAQTAPQPTLKVGLIAPLTTASADLGQPLLQGVQLAIEEINAAGGHMGQKLVLDIKDDQAKPERGVQLSMEWAKDKPVAVLGFCNTGVAAQAVDVYQENKIPLIIPCATGKNLTQTFPAPESYIFRVQAHDGLQIPFLIEDFLRKDLTKIAVFADDTGYGQAGYAEVLQVLNAKGLKPVYVHRFTPGVKDLSDALKAARQADANAILSVTLGADSATLANNKKALNWGVQYGGLWVLSMSNFVRNAGDVADGVLTPQTFIAQGVTERRAAFIRRYLQRYKLSKIENPMAAANGYDATYLLLYALQGSNKQRPTGPELKQALESKIRTYYGVMTTYDQPFSTTDKEAISANMLIMGKFKNGEITYAYPEDAKRNWYAQRKPKVAAAP